MHNTKAITMTAVMASIALLLSIARIEIPFYPLIYLKFDFAEIPSVLTFLLVGAKWGYLCALVHYAGLLARSGDPLGPTMKFLAVSSMLLGMQLSSSHSKLSLALGALVRIVAMSLANMLVIGFLFPSWIPAIQGLLKTAGLEVEGWNEVMCVTLMLTGVFNALHTLLSVIPAMLVEREVRRRV